MGHAFIQGPKATLRITKKYDDSSVRFLKEVNILSYSLEVNDACFTLSKEGVEIYRLDLNKDDVVTVEDGTLLGFRAYVKGKLLIRKATVEETEVLGQIKEDREKLGFYRITF